MVTLALNNIDGSGCWELHTKTATCSHKRQTTRYHGYARNSRPKPNNVVNLDSWAYLIHAGH